MHEEETVQFNSLCMFQTVPFGVLCFLSSYKALEKFTSRWQVNYFYAVTRVGITGGRVQGVRPPSSLCQPPTNIFSILLGVNRNPQFSQYEIGFPQQLKKLTAFL